MQFYSRLSIMPNKKNSGYGRLSFEYYSRGLNLSEKKSCQKDGALNTNRCLLQKKNGLDTSFSTLIRYWMAEFN